jgi:gluconokinase
VLILVMGVSGAGKTTVGSALARALGWVFVDADDFHAPDAIASMSAGQPLTDAQRAPWIEAIRERVVWHAQRGESVVLACSALRRAHRERLTSAVQDARIVHLRIRPRAAADRIAGRTGHFMPSELTTSQFDALEPPDDALELDASMPPEELVARIRDELGRG